MLFILISLSLLLDQLLGEFKRYHPLVGFGHCAHYLESKLNSKPDSHTALIFGLLAVFILVLPLSIASHLASTWLDSLSFLFTILVLYLTLGLKSLLQHSSRVAQALPLNQTNIDSDDGLENARYSTSLMVSRDTSDMSESELARATIESTLENGCDSTFGVLFWYVLGGIPMVIFYRLTNTLDAMWGYRTQRYELFGKSAAKLDDVLNYLPARLTALSYALSGNTVKAMKSWRTQARFLSSPNGGPVMTAGAGSLNIELGGPSIYHGELVNKPLFGGVNPAKRIDITRANRLVVRAVLIWSVAILLLSLIKPLLSKVS